MTAFECANDMVLDDAGLMFPDDNHPGVDLILPDYSYVLEHADKLRGISNYPRARGPHGLFAVFA